MSTRRTFALELRIDRGLTKDRDARRIAEISRDARAKAAELFDARPEADHMDVAMQLIVAAVAAAKCEPENLASRLSALAGQLVPLGVNTAIVAANSVFRSEAA